MKLGHWNLIIGMRSDIVRLLERTLAVDSTRFGERMSTTSVDPGTLSRLQTELRSKLEVLRENLNRELTENETYLVMFPLVLLCDEMVMIRLAKEQQTSWSLLQSELFQINYGGDVFYDFVDERLDKQDTPPMVFEVLYFCLAAGFVGKFGESSGKVQRYRTLLSEQIAATSMTAAERRKRRRASRMARDPQGERSSRRSRSMAIARTGSQRTLSPSASAPGPAGAPPAPAPSLQQAAPGRIPWHSVAPYGVALAALGLALGFVLLFTNL
ncbi:MAG TPA: DotU family type IV/VI secretion system protein [Pseudomonadota bacterium]|nr:DotU family type IV/VI secretion system protein [Pseudomonadota bacterium]